MQKKLALYYILVNPIVTFIRVPSAPLPSSALPIVYPSGAFCTFVSWFRYKGQFLMRLFSHDKKLNKRIETNTVNVRNDIDSITQQNLLLESPIHQCTGLDIAGFKICTGIIIINGVTNRRIINTHYC